MQKRNVFTKIVRIASFREKNGRNCINEAFRSLKNAILSKMELSSIASISWLHIPFAFFTSLHFPVLKKTENVKVKFFFHSNRIFATTKKKLCVCFIRPLGYRIDFWFILELLFTLCAVNYDCTAQNEITLLLNVFLFGLKGLGNAVFP